MHFLYIDEAGNTGADLLSVQQPAFVMAGLLVSDERWHRTKAAIYECLADFFGGTLPLNFELHAFQLLSPNGEGAFLGRPRVERNKLALDLLALIAERSHWLLQLPVYKSTLSAMPVPTKDFGFDWKHPWHFGFEMMLSMFEDFMRGLDTGQSSAGLAIVDHEEAYVDFVRAHTARRQSANGWRQLKKVVEIGYSVSSHANPLIQLTDLVAFTLKKHLELQTPFAAGWPDDAKNFYSECRDSIWPRVKFKTLSFQRLNVHCSAIEHAKSVRQP